MNVRVVYMHIRLACCRWHGQSGCLMPVCPQCFACTAIWLPHACLPAVLRMHSNLAASCLFASVLAAYFCALSVTPACLGGVERHADS